MRTLLEDLRLKFVLVNKFNARTPKRVRSSRSFFYENTERFGLKQISGQTLVMPASSQTTQVVTHRQTPRDVTVRSWPLAEGSTPVWSLLLAVGLGVGILGGWSGSIATAIVLAAVCLLACWRMLVPVEFELSAMGITRTALWSTRRIPWSVVGRIERRAKGVLVCRDVEPVPLEMLHALYVPFGRHESEVLTLLDFYLSGRANHNSTSHGTILP
jgi:hypothetical protein